MYAVVKTVWVCKVKAKAFSVVRQHYNVTYRRRYTVTALIHLRSPSKCLESEQPTLHCVAEAESEKSTVVARWTAEGACNRVGGGDGTRRAQIRGSRQGCRRR